MHKTVLLQEAVEQLRLKPGDVVIDATLGTGGHTIKLAQAVGKRGKVIAIDMDPLAIQEAKKRIIAADKGLLERIVFVQDNFRNIDKLVAEQGTSATKIAGILADLGWRIEQISDPRYGLSFNVDARLNMRLEGNKDRAALEGGEDAFEIVNRWSASELEKLFRELGEERFAGKIALAIEKARKKKQIETTTELAQIIKALADSFPGKQQARIHPATKVFQALRIQVNRELESLNIFLEKSLATLPKEGRLAVISFHSVEDRIVKKFFKEASKGCICPKSFPVCQCNRKPRLKLITRRPIVAGEAELKENRRARSAKLRVVEKI